MRYWCRNLVYCALITMSIISVTHGDEVKQPLWAVAKQEAISLPMHLRFKALERHAIKFENRLWDPLLFRHFGDGWLILAGSFHQCEAASLIVVGHWCRWMSYWLLILTVNNARLRDVLIAMVYPAKWLNFSTKKYMFGSFWPTVGHDKCE